ncbi:MAG: hypothetical protein J5988_14035, partial [Eubacterium sp.]|nr:hypothetical protein [Eubacterium sp.]
MEETGVFSGGILKIPENPAAKSVLVELLVPHTVEDGFYVIRIPLALIAGLGLSPELKKLPTWETRP